MFKSLLAIFINTRTIAISMSSYNAVAFQQEKYLFESNTNVSSGKKGAKVLCYLSDYLHNTDLVAIFTLTRLIQLFVWYQFCYIRLDLFYFNMDN